MEAQNLNSSTRRVGVTSSSKNFALTAATTGAVNAIITNFGTEPAFFTAGQGAAVTAVYPTSDGSAVTGKRVPAGSVSTWSLPIGTTHISYITGSGSVDADVAIGHGL